MGRKMPAGDSGSLSQKEGVNKAGFLPGTQKWLSIMKTQFLEKISGSLDINAECFHWLVHKPAKIFNIASNQVCCRTFHCRLEDGLIFLIQACQAGFLFLVLNNFNTVKQDFEPG